MEIPPLIAHRLGRAYGPDSSVTALERALAGADALETDVCLTADEALVLLHDPLLRLGTDLDGWAHERSLAEIRRGRLLAGGRAADERPMALEELLERVPCDVPIQVEIKAQADQALAARTARVLCERYRHTAERNRLEVLSFHTAACAVAASHGFASRLVVFADYAPEALAAWTRRHGIRGVSVEHFLLTPGLAATLRLAGLSVNTGTVNDPELLLRMVATVAPDAVCTDRPTELRAEARALRARATESARAPLAA